MKLLRNRRLRLAASALGLTVAASAIALSLGIQPAAAATPTCAVTSVNWYQATGACTNPDPSYTWQLYAQCGNPAIPGSLFFVSVSGWIPTTQAATVTCPVSFLTVAWVQVQAPPPPPAPTPTRTGKEPPCRPICP